MFSRTNLTISKFFIVKSLKDSSFWKKTMTNFICIMKCIDFLIEVILSLKRYNKYFHVKGARNKIKIRM